MVSIVIPAYNAAKYIYNCVSSILNQNYQNFEIIIIDDGSTDDTLRICQSMADTQKKIRILHQKNSGVSAARKSGVLISKGEYILFVDSDDTISPNLLTNLIPHTQKDYDIIQSGATIDKECSGEYFVRQTMLAKSPPRIWGKLFKRQILNENLLTIPREINIGEDLILNIRIGLVSQTVYSVADNYYNYNIHEGSAMSNRKVSQDYEELFLVAVKESLGESLEQFRNEYTRMQLASMENIIVCRLNLDRNKNWVIEATRNSANKKLSRREWIVTHIKNSTLCRYLLAGERRIPKLFPK